MNFTYLLVNFFTILIPFLFSFHPKIQFHKQWKAFFTAGLLTAFIFIIWDIYFTRIGVWSFNPRYTLGWNVAGLPLEEVLFFFCIPYACVFTYYCLTKFYDLGWNGRTEVLICIFLALVFLVLGLLHLDKLYTSSTFLSAAILCLFIKFVARVNWLGKAFTVYGVLLLPFFIVNGVLTGSGLDQAVVQYNNAENLHIRLFTIPIEDIVYGFELVLLNLFFFQLQLKRENVPVHFTIKAKEASY